jgi:hypothetical protein
MSDRTELRLAFGAQLRGLMLAQDLSPRTLAQRALGDESRSALLTSWIHGQRLPSKANAEKLNQFFGVDLVVIAARRAPSRRKPIVNVTLNKRRNL